MTVTANADFSSQVTSSNPLSEGATAHIGVSTQSPLGPSSNAPSSIAFVDRSISDIDTLIQGIEASKIVLIESDKDGIAQVSQTLSNYQNLESVHIFSHGSDAQLMLGSGQLNASTLTQYSDELTQWGKALSSSGDLLLYGCDVASSQAGIEFVQNISAVTGADVAASNDLTGAEGDWTLESVVGSVGADVGLSVIAQSQYNGTLSLLKNGGFESGISNWTTFSGGESIANKGAFAGNKALSLNSANDGVGQLFEVEAGQTYQLKSRAKSSANGYNAMGVSFFDGNYNTLSNESSGAIAGNSWKAYQLETTAPEGTVFAQVWAYRGGNSGKVLIDKVELTAPQFSGGNDSGSGNNGSGNNGSEDSGFDQPERPGNNADGGSELLGNGNFEAGLSKWRTFKGTERATSTDSFDGTKALQLLDGDSGTEQLFEGIPGKTYRLAGRAKSSSKGYSGFGAHFLDSAYRVLSSIGGSAISSNQWKEYSTEGIAPEETAFVQAWTYKVSSDGRTLIDGLSVTAEGAVVEKPPVETPPIEKPPVEKPPTVEPPTEQPKQPAEQPEPPTGNGQSPVITSNGGKPTASIFLDEGTSSVTQVKATGRGLSYAIAGGADANDFTINRSTGELAFKNKPDYEAPADANGDNVYDVSVSVQNGAQQDQQALSVTVKNKVSVFLLGGQSNMVGQGINNELSGGLAQPYSDVKIWDSQDFSNLRPGFSGPTGTWGEFGPELTFGRGINGHTQEEVYLIKHATGATNLVNDWDPDGANNVEYDIFVNRVSDALAHLDGENTSYDIEGMLWMQGESDTGYSASSYGENLTEFIGDMRDRYNPNLKFVIGKIHDAFGPIVPTEQESVAAADPLAYIVDTDNFELRSDGVHYNTAGQIKLGNAFANAIKNS